MGEGRERERLVWTLGGRRELGQIPGGCILEGEGSTWPDTCLSI